MCVSNEGGSEPFLMLRMPKCCPGTPQRLCYCFGAGISMLSWDPLCCEEVSVSPATGLLSAVKRGVGKGRCSIYFCVCVQSRVPTCLIPLFLILSGFFCCFFFFFSDKATKAPLVAPFWGMQPPFPVLCWDARIV